MQVPFFKLDVTDSMRKAVDEVISSGWLTSGPKVLSFEEAFATRLGAKHAVAVNSCTAALHLALEAIGIGPGDRVLVPTMTFAATAEVIRYLGADPVFVDVCPQTALMTPESVQVAIDENSDIKACMPVHFGGLPCDMEGLHKICDPQGIRIIDDAAHAFPAAIDDRPIGTWADASCFSFYANKTLTTGEGGMIITDDDDIAAHARIMRLHGMNRDAWGRFTVETAKWEYDLVAPGYKYNMPDIAAALGLAQFPEAERHCAARTHIANRYGAELGDLEAIQLCQTRDGTTHAWHLFWLVLQANCGIDRNSAIDHLQQRGISCSVHYKPLHRMTYWAERLNLKPDDFPGAESIWQGCFSLPIFPCLNDSEQSFVIDEIKALIG